MDWLAALNPSLALVNVHTDILGDWYRDPWSWPELQWVVDKAPDRIAARLNETGARRVLPIDVVKENFSVRPALLLDPLDRLCYQALVDRVSAVAIGKLSGWAYGWRLGRISPTAGMYAKNSQEWNYYRSRLQFLATAMPYGLATDIVSFFASVDISRLIEDLRPVVGSKVLVDRLETFLQALQSLPSRSGLPQRCWASSVLAHFVLRPLDDLLAARAPQAASIQPYGPGVTRWMDDIWVFAEDSQTLRFLQLDLQDLLRQRGLNMNAGKTEVYEGETLKAHAKALEHSGVDAALRADPPDDAPLRELVERLLQNPETASRTSLRFAMTRIRKTGAFELTEGIVDAALRMPHAADHIARLLRDSEAWRGLIEWYIDNCRTYGGVLTWSMYHLGTMFPSSGDPPEALLQYWLEALSSGAVPLLMVPLVAQRLAAWDPDSARPAIRAAARQGAYAHPFALRALGFAGRSSDIPPTDVRKLLGQFAENDLSLRYLEGRSMKAPKVGADFAGQ